MAEHSHIESSIETRISRHLSERGRTIRNKAALGALVKIIPTVGEGLHHALTAGDDAIRDEKMRLQLDLLCELAEKIDGSISDMLAEAQSRGVALIEVAGDIAVRGEHADDVTG